MSLSHNLQILARCVLAPLILISPAHAASFDCAKSKTQIEQLICNDANVSALDSALGSAFQNVTKITSNRKAMVEDQRNWLHNVRDLCKKSECIKLAYENRLRYLEEVQQRLKLSPAKSINCGVNNPESPKPNCKLDVICATNSNYSILQAVIDQCPDAQTRDIRVYYYETRDSKPVLLDTLKNQEVMEADFADTDQNGNAQLDVSGFCGGSPNCQHDLYRYDPKDKVLYNYFSSVYAGLTYFDGYLVGSGRASCCSWEYRAHKLHKEGSREKVDDRYFIISVFKDSEDKNKPANCRFFEYIGKNGDGKNRAVKPPGRKWLSFCEHYDGSYKLQ